MDACFFGRSLRGFDATWHWKQNGFHIGNFDDLNIHYLVNSNPIQAEEPHGRLPLQPRSFPAVQDLLANDFGYAWLEKTPRFPGLEDFSNEPKHEGEKNTLHEAVANTQHQLHQTHNHGSGKSTINDRKLQGAQLFTSMIIGGV